MKKPMAAEETSPRSVNLSREDLVEAVMDFVGKRYGCSPGTWRATVFLSDGSGDVKIVWSWRIPPETEK